MSTFSAKKGPRESQHPAAKKALPVDSDTFGLARLSPSRQCFFFAGCGYGHQAVDDGLGVTNRFRFGKTSAASRDVEDGEAGDLSPAPKISPGISPPGARKKSCNFKDLRKISPISPISPGCRGFFLTCLHIHKETLNFTLLIYICT